MPKLKTLLVMVVFALSSYSMFRTVMDIRQKSKRVVDIEAEISALEKENADLAYDLAYKNTKEFVEKEAREKLFMGFPGEHVLVIPQNFFEQIDKLKIFEGKINDENVPVWKQWVALVKF
ncbi:MAG: septum formation initiator family protein [bacterium]